MSEAPFSDPEGHSEKVLWGDAQPSSVHMDEAEKFMAGIVRPRDISPEAHYEAIHGLAQMAAMVEGAVLEIGEEGTRVLCSSTYAAERAIFVLAELRNGEVSRKYRVLDVDTIFGEEKDE